MHDSAFHIGTLAMNIYADLKTDSILEIGSQAINGSLRENAFPITHYVGVDIEEGDGVDLVAEPGKPLPIKDNSFDLVLATSVFEHDPCFWITFLEMCRGAKDGGYIYINAPSNGVVHRYPEDNWRFYPDSGKALAKWATSQGMAVTLVESFIAKREKDIWNDFVAVFRKGRITKSLPKVFLHENVPCTDVTTWKSTELIHPSIEPEDMLLLREAEERARCSEEALAQARSERDSLAAESAQLNVRLNETEGKRHRLLEEIDRIQNAANLRESELRQRQEEIEQTRLELAQARSEISSLRTELSASEQRLEREVRQRQQTEILLDSEKASCEQEHGRVTGLIAVLKQVQCDKMAVEATLDEYSNQLAGLTEEIRKQQDEATEASQALAKIEGQLTTALAQKDAAEANQAERLREVAALTTSLVEQGALLTRYQEQTEWLRETAAILLTGSTTLKGRLLALLPVALRPKYQRRLLKRMRLFDGYAYLKANPDVAAQGADPLRHYLRHGLPEHRRRD